MENLPDSLYEDYSQLKLTASSSAGSSSVPATTFIPPPVDLDMMALWINDLKSPIIPIFNNALQNLVDNRENFEIFPLMLWQSIGTVSIMLREVIAAYRQITNPFQSAYLMPMRVYNVLLLFQCITLHPETRGLFLKAKMPHYFYALMSIDFTAKPLERIRLAALGVIAHLLKAPVSQAAVGFLMKSGAFLYCTKPIEIGSTDSKTLAVFILQKIMSTNDGIHYCSVLPDRFFVINNLLMAILNYLSSTSEPSATLFNIVVACYATISEKPRACQGLRRFPPVKLFYGTFNRLLAEDPVTHNNWRMLIHNMENTMSSR